MAEANITDTRHAYAAAPRYLVSPDEALELVRKHALPRAPRLVPLDECCGLRLAEDIHADRDYPAFDRAMMDGYAVRLSDAERTVDIVAEVAAGGTPGERVSAGRGVEIMTGAVCPPGTEAVVPKELARRSGRRVTLPADLRLGQHLAAAGSECRAGRCVLPAGETLSPLAVAVLASCGFERVRVIPRPVLAIITTGTELVAPGRLPALGQIRNSNGPMLAAMACQAGLAAPRTVHAPDERAALQAALQAVAACDLVLFSGGVSAGNYDLVPQTLSDFGATIIFHQVAQKPGKPLLLASRGSQLLFGLPGNPLACHLGFHRYVTAAIGRMQAQVPAERLARGQLDTTVRSQHRRTFFLLARAAPDASAVGGWRLEPLAGHSSADIFAPSRANCYVQVPPGDVELPAGEVVSFTWTGQGR